MINQDNSIASRIRISCKKEGTRTLLSDNYFDIPYKIVHYGSKLLQEHLEIMMMCYSPGVMDGDSLEIDIHCPEKTEMKLFTQSFSKLHPMEKGAKQAMKVRIEEGALFQFVPQPTIPFKDTCFQAANEIYVHKGGHLIWGDVISGGRIHSGERFRFTKLHTQTKIYQDKQLVFYDNQVIEPGRQPLEDLLFFEGYTHQGTLVLSSQYASAIKEELDAILTEQFSDMSYGFTQCSDSILMLRALGASGEAMHDWLANIGNMYWSFIKYQTEQAPPLQQAKEEIAEQETGLRKQAKEKTPVKKRDTLVGSSQRRDTSMKIPLKRPVKASTGKDSTQNA